MQKKYKVVETFVSINGEGKRAGQLAVFIRFAGCNLHCSYCDTLWANATDAPYEWMTAEDIYNYIKEIGILNATLTGGEPLIQEHIGFLLEELCSDTDLSIEIETNGSVDVSPFRNIKNTPSFTIDYKLAESSMESKMCLCNFENITSQDTIKFVAGSKSDLMDAKRIIETYNLAKRCSVYLSAVFDKLHPEEIVTFMKENCMNGVNLQLQLHKYIWSPNEKGV